VDFPQVVAPTAET